MIAPDEIVLGQLAIARGHISLPRLLSVMEKVGATGRTLTEVLLSDGCLTKSEVEAIKHIIETDDEAVLEEMKHGATIVSDQFITSATLSETIDEAAQFFSAPAFEQVVEQRYIRRDELGRGGMGEVYRATDRILQRDVAIKKLLPNVTKDSHRRLLLMEARVTGLLEHPSIVPVYDLLEDDDGPCYTMRVVEEQSLAEVLRRLRDDPQSMPLTQLVSILRQVSLAVQFAHDKGVVHRDLKPENILIGEYGEVYVIDWGIAKILNAESGLETGERNGALFGTPRYMAPEQARGENDRVDRRADVYALGAILYEMLTLESMYSGAHILAVLVMVVHESPIPPSQRTERVVPAVLEEVCLRAVAKDPRERFQSATAFADELEAFLDGVKEAERIAELAQAAFEQANQVRAVYRDVRDRHREQVVSLRAFRKDADKNALWDAEQYAEDLKIEIERRFTDVVAQYGQALVHNPEHKEAYTAIGELYWERFRDAELNGDRALAAYFEGLVRQYNDGRYDVLLEGNAKLVFEPELLATGQVHLSRFQSVRRRLVPWEVAELTSPEITSGRGSYLINYRSDEYTSLRIPVTLERGETLEVHVPRIPKKAVPPGFVVVSGGRFLPSSNADSPLFLETFAIQKFPVTVAEYLEFLNEIGLDSAEPHLPRTGGVTYVRANQEGRFVIEDPDGDEWDEKWPMCIVNYFDARRYIEWKSERDGVQYRLPTIEEWQKAARGVDGRAYPWGDHFDDSFCRMRDSEPGRSLPAAVGIYQADESPYGVRDMCGNVAEWTSTVVDEGEGVRVLGGASYNSFAEMCRLDFTMTSPPGFKFGHYGFRLAIDLDGFDS